MSKLLALSGGAIMNLLDDGMSFFNYMRMPHHDETPGDSFVDEEGNTWTKLLDEDLIQQFGIDEEIFKGGVQLDGANTFPAHFWTAPNSRGREYGWGAAPGNSFVAFKSGRNGRFMSQNEGDGTPMKGNREELGPWEKFRPTFLGGNMVALKAWNNRWVACDKANEMQANRGGIGPWEQFYVYTTSDREGGLSQG